MIRIIFLLFLLLSKSNVAKSDIAPNPIETKSIMPGKDCEVEMESEVVNVILYKKKSIVECTFNLINHGDSLTLPIGFPIMNFYHWRSGFEVYKEEDKNYFNVFVNDQQIDKFKIYKTIDVKILLDRFFETGRKREEISDQIRKESSEKAWREKYKYGRDSEEYLQYRNKLQKELLLKSDSILKKLDALYLSDLEDITENKNIPWYLWNVFFEKGERKVIKVIYSVPSGIGYGAKYRFFQYFLSTGSGWKNPIKSATVKIHFKNISMKKIEESSPNGCLVSKKEKSLTWNFNNIEPAVQDNIYVRYYIRRERKSYKRRMARKMNRINKNVL